jgi:long-chain acyl-CoA synthetase
MKKPAGEFKVVPPASPDEGTGPVYAGRPRNLARLLSNTVKNCGDREGVIITDPAARLSFRQFASSVDNVASALYHDYGVRKGDRVALMLMNGLEFAASFFALARLGAITVPLNTALKGEELAFQVADSGAAVLIVEPKFHQLMAGVSSGVKGVKHIFVTGDETPAGTVAFSELLRERQSPPEVRVDEMDSAVIMYTSGTTGTPKGALLSHQNIITGAMNMAQLCDLRVGRDKILVVVPLFHITGLAIAFCSAVYAGIPAVIVRKFKTEEALKIIEEEKVTTMVAVPTILWLLLNEPAFASYDLSSMRQFAAGGSASPEELLKACAAKLPGVQLMPGYGLTEATAMTHTTTSLDEALARLGSVGKALLILEDRVVDASGKELPPGQPGELLVKGCQVMKEYWNNPEATRQTIVDGWLHTGDIARVAEDGYTYILDRMKDMIIRGGENIYSIEVENVLYRHPKVLEAAVVGVDDQVFGEQVKAALVLKSGERATAEEIQEFCGQYLARFKVPKYIEFMESLPRNPAGKVIKARLK